MFQMIRNAVAMRAPDRPKQLQAAGAQSRALDAAGGRRNARPQGGAFEVWNEGRMTWRGMDVSRTSTVPIVLYNESEYSLEFCSSGQHFGPQSEAKLIDVVRTTQTLAPVAGRVILNIPSIGPAFPQVVPFAPATTAPAAFLKFTLGTNINVNPDELDFQIGGTYFNGELISAVMPGGSIRYSMSPKALPRRTSFIICGSAFDNGMIVPAALMLGPGPGALSLQINGGPIGASLKVERVTDANDVRVARLLAASAAVSQIALIGNARAFIDMAAGNAEAEAESDAASADAGSTNSNT